MQSLIYFLIVAALFIFMMRFGCGSHVMGHGHRHGRHDQGGADAGGAGPGATPVQAKDPVCGMTIETATAKSTLYQGAAYYFCSASCRDKFEASPRSYIQLPSATIQHKEAEHGAHH